MANEIVLRPASHYVGKSGVKALIYGRSGIGKTRLVLTCTKALILSCEGGLRSLGNAQIATYPPIYTLADLINAYNWIVSNAAAKQFETIFIDSISEIAEVILANSQGKFKDGRLAYQDAFQTLLHGAVRKFRDLPEKNVVFTAKEDFEKDGDSGLQMYMPGMPSKAMRAELPYFFDEVFRLVGFTDPATNATAVFLQTSVDSRSVAKDRSGKLQQWEAPDLSAIFAKMNA